MTSKRVPDYQQTPNQKNQLSPQSSNGVLSSSSSLSSQKSRTLPQFGSNLGSNSRRTTPIYATDEYDDDEEEEEDDSTNHDKMKTMFMSMWNNVKYGFATKLKTSFSFDSPIWLLSQIYHKRPNESMTSSRYSDGNQSKESELDKFKHDFYSRIWFTYRKDFPKLSGSHFTTDCGWGCMLRSGQMMLAHTLLMHYLGRQWRWNGQRSDKEDMIHRMIIKWFADEPNGMTSPFSVHQLVNLGEHLGKKPGDWYGPASVAHLIRYALTNASSCNPVLSNICCYVAQDCTVYIQDVIDLCTSSPTLKANCFSNINRRDSKALNKSLSESLDHNEIEVATIASEMSFESNSSSCSPNVIQTTSYQSASKFNHNKAPSTFNLTTEANYSHNSSTSGPHSLSFSPCNLTSTPKSNKEATQQSGKWRGVIIIVPVRLGGERFNSIYSSCVKQLLSHHSCIGIIGGKPKHSLYFVGWQEDKIIFLDPHKCQPTVNVQQSNFPLDSFHCNSPRKMSFSSLDPSSAIGFYLRTRSDLYEWMSSVRSMLIPPNQGAEYPIYVFDEGSQLNDHSNVNHLEKNEDKILRVKHRYINEDGKVEREYQADEFVML